MIEPYFLRCGLACAQLYLIEWIFTLFAKSLPAEPVRALDNLLKWNAEYSLLQTSTIRYLRWLLAFVSEIVESDTFWSRYRGSGTR